MKVFISWSGDLSQQVAEILRGRIRLIINSADPWVSSQDINAGSRWRDEVATKLKAARFGIICVTRENQGARWLNFEAGALASAIDTSRVVPLTVDLNPADVTDPLSEFQAQPVTQEGLRKLFHSMNELAEAPLASDILSMQLDVWCPKIESEVKAARERFAIANAPTVTPVRTQRELLEEVVEAVRGVSRQSGGVDQHSSRILLAHLAADRVRNLFPNLRDSSVDINHTFSVIEVSYPRKQKPSDWLCERAQEIIEPYGLKLDLEEDPF